MEIVCISASCDVRDQFIRQIDGKYPVNGIAISSSAPIGRDGRMREHAKPLKVHETSCCIKSQYSCY
jgi:hypothetical protein